MVNGEKMQYALIEIDNRKLFIDIHEYHSLNRFNDSITLDLTPLSSLPHHICYGAYIPQPGTSVRSAVKDLKYAKEHFLGYIDEDKCYSIAIEDIEIMKEVSLYGILRIPVALLITACDDVIEDIKEAKESIKSVTGFLRFQSNPFPVTDLLHRRGLFALKEIDPVTVTPSNWSRNIDRDRPKHIAREIW